MSGKFGLGSNGRDIETLDLAYRPSCYQIHAFSSATMRTSEISTHEPIRVGDVDCTPAWDPSASLTIHEHNFLC
jgi:hypothetical protein